MSTQSLSGPQPVHNSGVFASAITQLKGVKAKYIDKDRADVRASAQKVSNATTMVSRIGFSGIGISAGILIGLKLAALTIAAGLGVAAMATPIGWAVLGLAVIALAALAIRHVYLKSQGMETNTLKELAKDVLWGLHTAVYSSILVASGGNASGGAIFLSVFAGAVLSPTFVHTLNPIYEYSDVKFKNESSRDIDPSKKEKQFFYKGEHVEQGKDGALKITNLNELQKNLENLNNQSKIDNVRKFVTADTDPGIKGNVSKFIESNDNSQELTVDKTSGHEIVAAKVAYADEIKAHNSEISKKRQECSAKKSDADSVIRDTLGWADSDAVIRKIKGMEKDIKEYKEEAVRLREVVSKMNESLGKLGDTDDISKKAIVTKKNENERQIANLESTSTKLEKKKEALSIANTQRDEAEKELEKLLYIKADSGDNNTIILTKTYREPY